MSIHDRLVDALDDFRRETGVRPEQFVLSDEEYEAFVRIQMDLRRYSAPEPTYSFMGVPVRRASRVVMLGPDHGVS